MTTLAKKIVCYTPTFIVVCIILFGTLTSNPMGNTSLPPIPYIDKIIHAVMMGGLLGTFAFDWQRANPDKRLTPSFLWAVFGCVLAFGIADELLQGYIDNGRSGDPYDFLADCIGAAIAVYLAPPVIRCVLHIHRTQKVDVHTI